MPPDARTQARENLLDWHGRLLGIQTRHEVRTYVAPPKAKVRPRLPIRNPQTISSTRSAASSGAKPTWLLRVATEDRRVGSRQNAPKSSQRKPRHEPRRKPPGWPHSNRASAEKAPPLFSRRSQALGLEEERIDERF